MRMLIKFPQTPFCRHDFVFNGDEEYIIALVNLAEMEPADSTVRDEREMLCSLFICRVTIRHNIFRELHIYL